MPKQTGQVREESVRDCLTHLYDYAFLKDHPLVRVLAPRTQGNSSPVQLFRQIVFEAIDRLKPHDLSNPQTKNNRLYTILQLRYQQQQQVQYVLKLLNLGERQFYRDHAKAVQALAHVLEEYVPDDASVPFSNTLSLHSEIERVQRQTAIASTSAEEFLRNTLNAVKHLQERQKAELDLQVLEAVLPGSVDQTVLRQVIIWIMSQLLIQSPLSSRFTISFVVKDSAARFCFTRNCELVAERLPYLPQNSQATFETLLSALGAIVYASSSYGLPIEIILEIPCQQYSVLVIDDNPDVTALFRQYLAGQPYQVFTAIDGAQAVELASQIHPQFIILDVLLPKHDGWEILQQLKNHPATLTTPVFICSVLDAQDLAMLLGADGFLHKPPEQSEFMEVLNRFSGHLTKNGSRS